MLVANILHIVWITEGSAWSDKSLEVLYAVESFTIDVLISKQNVLIRSIESEILTL